MGAGSLDLVLAPRQLAPDARGVLLERRVDLRGLHADEIEERALAQTAVLAFGDEQTKFYVNIGWGI